jgi:hypothetical protein
MASPVDRMLMAGGVSRDPLLAGPSAQHGAVMIHRQARGLVKSRYSPDSVSGAYEQGEADGH